MIGIIGAMEEEVEILRSLLTDLRVEKHPRCPVFEFFTGKLAGKDVVLLKSGIGKVQAAVGAALLLERYSPSLVINTGCAGGINPAGAVPLNFGDLVVSSALVYHDFDISAFGYQRGQVPGQKSAFFEVKEALVKKALECAGRLNLNAQAGLIASGDIFVADSKKVLDFLQVFPDLRAVEMEGAAIAHVCVLFGTDFVVFRCLSDIAGEESPVSFDKFLPAAARNSSDVVLSFIKTLQEE